MRAATSPLHMILVGLWNFVTLTIALAVALGIAITGPPTRSETAALETGMHRVMHHLGIAAHNLKRQVCERLAAEIDTLEACRRPEPGAAAGKAMESSNDGRGALAQARLARHSRRGPELKRTMAVGVTDE